jgi:hypothetical protein
MSILEETFQLVRMLFLATLFMGLFLLAISLTLAIFGPFLLHFLLFYFPFYLSDHSLFSLAVLAIIQVILSYEVKILKKDKKTLLLLLAFFFLWFIWAFFTSISAGITGITEVISLSIIITLTMFLLILDSFQLILLAVKIFLPLLSLALDIFKLKHLAEINTYYLRIFSFQKLRQKPLLTIFHSFLFVIGILISGFVLLLWLSIVVGILKTFSLTEIALYVYKNLNDLLGTQMASFVSFLILLSYLKIVQYLIIKVGKFRVVENEEEEIEIHFG